MRNHSFAHLTVVCVGTVALFSLAACGDHDSSGGGASTLSLTPSVSVSAVVGGGSQTVSLGFNSSDTQKITNLSVTSGLSPMPAGWSGPNTFTCASVSTGSGCLLNLVYKPVAVSAGTLTIGYRFTNDGNVAQNATATINYASTTNNNAVATAAPAGQITAMVGHGTQAVAVTFTTDDGNPATALTLTTDLATLPTGWSSTATSLTCASLSTGNGCQLPLSYTPPAIASGTLTLGYSYKDNSGDSKTGTLTLAYVGTSSDNVVGTVSPSGQVVSVLGSGTQAVTVTFTTDDGNTASAMSLTSALSALPSGWSSTATSLICATLSTGNGCQLPLSFAPVNVGSGTLALTYSYTDVGGHAKTGTVNVPYAGTIHDNVVGTTSPSGQINALVGGGTQTVQLTFNTDDGNFASAFSIISNLNSLPAGWSSAVHSLNCAQASSGNTCQLTLTFAPTAVASGTLTLQYSYTDNAGATKTGVASIPYAGTVHDNVISTAAPSGQIAGAIGDAGHTVSVTFMTDDGNPATALSITSGALSALPPGWTASPGGLNCGTVSTGIGCQLGLTFTPALTASGTLAISYAYTDNAGSAKTGTVNIAYVSTSHNTAITTPSQPGTISVKPGDSKTIHLFFTTNDGNTATGLSITSNLSALPAGWSGASGFTCSTFNTGSGCSLSLTYAPLSTAVGTFNVDYSYTDSSGAAKTGLVTITYANPHLYVSSGRNGVYLCPINSDNTLSNCSITAASGSVHVGSRVAFSGTFAFVDDGWTYGEDVCAFNLDGTLTGCTSTGVTSGSSGSPAVIGSYLYTSDGPTLGCLVNLDGSLSGCTAATTITGNMNTMTASGGYVYFDDGSTVYVCSPAGSGYLNSCAGTGSAHMSGSNAITAAGAYLYGANNVGGVTSCLLGADGTLSACNDYSIVPGSDAADLMVDGTAAWVLIQAAGTTHIYVCTVTTSTGAVSGCAISDGGLTSIDAYQLAYQ